MSGQGKKKGKAGGLGGVNSLVRAAVNAMKPRPTDPEDDDELMFLDPRNSRGLHTARQNVERAITFLLSTFGRPAILLARDWNPLGTPHEFEHLDTYRAITEAAKLHILITSRPKVEGVEHLLFVGRGPNLSDKQLFDCIGAEFNQRPPSPLG